VSFASNSSNSVNAVGRAAGEPRDDLAIVESAHFARIALHDLVAERDLPVATDRDTPVAANANDRRTVKLGHWALIRGF
jgi:hypothetical protein